MGLFFDVRRPRKFDYRPIYYDERKEALQHRVERIKRELDREGSTVDYRADLKGVFTGRSRLSVHRKSVLIGRPSIAKTGIALIVLVGILYLLYRF